MSQESIDEWQKEEKKSNQIYQKDVKKSVNDWLVSNRLFPHVGWAWWQWHWFIYQWGCSVLIEISRSRDITTYMWVKGKKKRWL